MSVALTVTADGYGWDGQRWYYVGAGVDREIGTNLKMTGFSFRPTKTLREVTISFNVNVANSNVRYSLTKPTVIGSSAPGTDITLAAGDNQITLTGSFAANTTYTLWVWGTGGVWTSTVRSWSGSGEESGAVRLYVSGAWGLYEPYIRVGNNWVRYEPRIYSNGEWRATG